MSNIHSKLKNKSWNEKDIHKTIKILHRAESKKTSKTKFFEKLAKILIVTTALVTTIFGAIFLLLILTVIRGYYSYLITIFLALFLGYIIDMILNKTTLIKNSFLQFALVLATSLLTVYLLVDTANNTFQEFQVNSTHNPIYVALAYSIPLMIPFFTHYFIKITALNKNIYK